MHGLVCCLGSLDRLRFNAFQDRLAAIQCRSETLAGFDDFFFGHVDRGGHQGAHVFGKRAHVIADCLYLSVHRVRFFLLVRVVQGLMLCIRNMCVSGELATFRIEFISPNGLPRFPGACGSGIYSSSTTKRSSPDRLRVNHQHWVTGPNEAAQG